MEKQNVYVIDGEAARADAAAIAHAVPKRKAKKRAVNRRSAPTAGAHGGLPRLGASCSMLLSGCGHLIHHRWKTGVFYLAVFAGALATPFLLGLAWPRLETLAARQGLGAGDLLVGLLLLDVFFIAAWLSSVSSAYAIGRAYRGDVVDEAASPLAAAAASVLVPGWGQIVNGQIGKALVFLAVVYAGALGGLAWLALPGPIARLSTGMLGGVSSTLPVLVVTVALAVIGSVTWALSVYDAALVARYHGRPRRAASVQVHSRARRPRRTSAPVSAARSA